MYVCLKIIKFYINIKTDILLNPADYLGIIIII